MDIKRNVPIGQVVAQACASSITQHSLSSFHQVGAKDAESDSSTYSKYLRMALSPSMKVTYIVPTIPLEEALLKLKCLYLKDLIHTYCISSSVYASEYTKYYDERRLAERVSSSGNLVCIRLTLKKDLMYLYRINIMYVRAIVEKFMKDTIVIHSPTKDCILEVFYIDPSKDITLLALGLIGESSEDSLKSIQVNGIPGVSPQYTVNGRYLVCKGVNMRAVYKSPYVNVSETFTNDIGEMYKYYGIDVTVESMRRYMAIRFGLSIDKGAIDILVYNMTYQGKPIPVSYQGTKEQGRSTLFNMCYERFLEHVRSSVSIGGSLMNDPYERIALGLPLSPSTGNNRIHTSAKSAKEKVTMS